MKKLINLVLVLVVGLIVGGCAALETGYTGTKKVVKAVVSDEKREKYQTKNLDKVITGVYGIVKKTKSEKE